MTVNYSEDLDAAARRILSKWGLSGEPERLDLGLNKATWRIGDYWLSSDFAAPRDQIARLDQLLERVGEEFDGAVQVPRFLRAKSDAIVEAEGRLWWVTRNIDGRHPDPNSADDMQAVAGGLALMHQRLRAIPSEYAVSTDTCEGLFRAGEELVTDDRLGFTPDDLTVARAGATAVVERLDEIRRPGMQITHGDPSNPNLFVAGQGPVLVGAIDWDYARHDLLISDVATMAQTILFRATSEHPYEYLQQTLTDYVDAGGIALSIDDVLVGVIMVLFEAIAHHGNRYILGQGDYDRVGGRVANIRTVLGMLGG
jgi:aminoglycoside phosphotransferase (APT) family kinase protein